MPQNDSKLKSFSLSVIIGEFTNVEEKKYVTHEKWECSEHDSRMQICQSWQSISGKAMHHATHFSEILTTQQSIRDNWIRVLEKILNSNSQSYVFLLGNEENCTEFQVLEYFFSAL